MPSQIIHTPDAPSSPLYSQGTIAGGHLYVSGMVGIDPGTGQLAGSDIAAQTRRLRLMISCRDRRSRVAPSSSG